MYMDKIVSKQPLKDNRYVIKGWIEIDSKGNQKLTNFLGQIVGWYDAVRNNTLDVTGRIVAFGCNILTSLLK